VSCFVDHWVCQARTVSAPCLHTLAILAISMSYGRAKESTCAELAGLDSKPDCGGIDAFHHSKTEVVQKFFQICLMCCRGQRCASVSIACLFDGASPTAKRLDNENLDYARGPGQRWRPTPTPGTLSCQALLFTYLANNIFGGRNVPAYMTWSHLELL
jgi:hypothetical protein